MSLRLSIEVTAACYFCKSEKVLPRKASAEFGGDHDFFATEPKDIAHEAGWRTFAIGDYDHGHVRGHACGECHHKLMQAFNLLRKD